MQDLYRGFKKVNEDDKIAVLKHEGGHELTIAKNGLSKKQKSMLEKLPIYQAEGTQPVEQLDPAEELRKIGAQLADSVAENLVQGATQAATPEIPTQVEQVPEEQAVPTQTEQIPEEPAVPTEVQAVPEEIAREPQAEPGLAPEPQPVEAAPEEAAPQIYEQPKLGVDTSLQIPEILPQRPIKVARPLSPEEIIGSAKTTASQKMAAFSQMALQTTQEMKRLRTEFISRNREPIKAKQMYGDDLGKNILTTLALLFGGAGAGVTKGPNVALKMIEDDIERDLQRQREDRDAETNLYKEQLAMLGDERAAYIQSANMMRELYMMGIEEQKWKNDPNNFAAEQVRQLALRELKAKNDELDFSEATRKKREQMLTALANTNEISNGDPASYVDILVDNKADRDPVLKEIAARELIASNTPKLKELFNQLKEENTFLKTLKIPFTQMSILKKPDAIGRYKKLVEQIIRSAPGTEKEPEIQRAFMATIPEPWDTSADEELKEKALDDIIAAASITPVSRAYGLNLDQFARTKYTAPDVAAVNEAKDWALKNYNSKNPKFKEEAQYIIKKFGLEKQIQERMILDARRFTDK